MQEISKQTAVHVVLDRSGSMGTIKEETIGAFNAYVEQLAKDSPEANFSLTIFDSASIDTIMEGKAKDISPLTDATYMPRGMTPLYDAIAHAAGKLDVSTGDNKVLVILTDGQENCSREHTSQSVKKTLDAKQKDNNWLVIYLGANQDAFHEASKFGGNIANTMSFDTHNIGATMSTAYNSTQRYLRTGKLADAAFTEEERKEALA